MVQDVASQHILEDLLASNRQYCIECRNEIPKFVSGQNPKIAILACSDSRVIPELLFKKSIGDLFIVRVAGNVAMDSSVMSSLEYAVDHLKVNILLILGHTNCGAIKAAEEMKDSQIQLFHEIRDSFSLDSDHILANVKYQMKMLPQRSLIIKKALQDKTLRLRGGIYHLEDGSVELL